MPAARFVRPGILGPSAPERAERKIRFRSTGVQRETYSSWGSQEAARSGRFATRTDKNAERVAHGQGERVDVERGGLGVVDDARSHRRLIQIARGEAEVEILDNRDQGRHALVDREVLAEADPRTACIGQRRPTASNRPLNEWTTASGRSDCPRTHTSTGRSCAAFRPRRSSAPA